MAKIKTEYALRNDALVHVSAVESGLKCDCYCPGCGGAMIAKKGNLKIHHFAHQQAECAYGLETTLHLMAKEILEQEKQILLPKVETTNDCPYIISEPRTVHFDKVYFEAKFDDIIPDIIVQIGEKMLAVEIYVTHKVDAAKRKKILDYRVSTLEIDLSDVDRMVSMETLRVILLDTTIPKRWIYNHLAAYYTKVWRSLCTPLRRTGGVLHRYIWCPKTRSSEDTMDCLDCGSYWGGEYDGKKDEHYYLCSFAQQINSVDDLKRFIEAKKHEYKS